MKHYLTNVNKLLIATVLVIISILGNNIYAYSAYEQYVLLISDNDALYIFNPIDSMFTNTDLGNIVIPKEYIYDDTVNEQPSNVNKIVEMKYNNGIYSLQSDRFIYVETSCINEKFVCNDPLYNVWLYDESKAQKSLLFNDKTFPEINNYYPRLIVWNELLDTVYFEIIDNNIHLLDQIYKYTFENNQIELINSTKDSTYTRIFLSPDGQYIASNEQSNDSKGGIKNSLVIINTTTGNKKVIANLPLNVDEIFIRGWVDKSHLNDLATPQEPISNAPGAVTEADSGFQRPMTNDHYGYEWEQWTDLAGESEAAKVWHPGDDYNGPGNDCGMDVYAVANGVVRYVNTSVWGGLVIEHVWQGITVYSQYGHISYSYVTVNQQVNKGQLIADVGNVGTGSCHLHWEIREADHPNPTYGPWWTSSTLKVLSNVENYYEDPEWWVDNHGSYGSSSCAPWVTPGALQSGYTFCANEGGTCSFSGSASVGYGANSCYTYGNYTNTVSCNNDVFNDPISGVGKSCYYKTNTLPPEEKVTLYEHADYSGAGCTIPGEGGGDICSNINNQASSIRMQPGWSSRVYEGSNFTGSSKCFTSDDNDFSNNTYDDGSSLNDSVSSFRAYNQTSCPNPDRTAPTGYISSPVNDSTLTSSPVVIQAIANDSESGVQKVEFHVLYDGSWHTIGEDTSYPYSISWDFSSITNQSVTLAIHIRDNAGNEVIDPGGYVYVTLDRPMPDSYENDNSYDVAKWIYTGQSQSHSIVPVGDIDWVKFTINAPSALTIETTGPASYDTRIWLYNSSLGEIEPDDDDGVGYYSFIDRVCGVDELQAGTYYIEVDEFANDQVIPDYYLNFNITGTCAPAYFPKTSPSYGATNVATTVNLSWQTSSGATSYAYCYDTNNNNSCDSSWISTGTNTYATISGLTQGVTYYWQARATNASGSTYGDNNSSWYFSTDGTAPTNPSSVSPNCTATDNAWQQTCGDPNFTWSGAGDSGSGVSGYYYYWGTDPNSTSASWTASADYNPGPVANPSTNYLRVQTKDYAGNTSSWITLFTFRFDDTDPTNPSSVNPNCTASNAVWQATCSDPNFTWSGQSDTGSGISGYYYYWGISSTGTTSNLISSAAYDPGVIPNPSTYYLRVQTRDNAGNVSSWVTLYTLMYDATAPSAPTTALPGCSASNDIWQNTCSDASFTWSGAGDSASGLAGYNYYWGTNSSGTANNYVPSAAYNPPAVPNPSINYLRVQSKDNAGNVSSWVSLFTLKYDAAAPNNPSVSSSSHTINTWSNDPTIDASWSAASDGSGSGVGGYSFEWSASSTTVPDAVADTTFTSTSSSTLATGASWYFHLRSRDVVGNWNSGATHYGPFKIDTILPTNPTTINPGCTATNDTWQKTCADPNFTWSGAVDANATIQGYYYYWGTDPAGTSANWTTATNHNPGAVPSPSTTYLRIKTKDQAGNESAWQTLFTFKYDNTAPVNPTACSSTPLASTWSNDNTVSVAFIGASDPNGSGVAGYSMEWNQLSSTIPDAIMDASGASTVSTPLATGNSWYIHIRTQDNLGTWNTGATHCGPFFIDTVAPTNATSATELGGTLDATWQNNSGDMNFTWGGASDANSGLVGYFYYWGTNPDGASTNWSSVAAYNPPMVGADGTYYLRVQARDVATNTSEWSTLYTLKYDATGPTNPTSFNGSHNPGTWSNDDSVELAMSGAGDGIGSGVYGYSLAWDQIVDTLPDQVIDSTNNSATSGHLDDGSLWYLHVRTRDNAGNWSDGAAHYGPMWIDTIAPPNIESVSELTGIADGVWQETDNDPSFSWTVVSDDASGLVGYRIYWGPGSGGTSTDLLVSTAFDPPAIPGDGPYYLRIQTLDRAGNNSPWSTFFMLAYDTQAPTSHIISATPVSCGQTYSILWDGVDTGSGVSMYDIQYRVGLGGEWVDWITGTSGDSALFGPAEPIDLLVGSEYFFRVRGTDALGHVETYSESVILGLTVTESCQYYLPGIQVNANNNI